jgi:SP family sugar:H+ symporter-like MFS transporter
VIANTGFTRHFGFPNRDGKYVLHANYTALWGAMQSLGQLVGMIILNPVSDRIGRKMTMYLLWLILAAVSYAPPSWGGLTSSGYLPLKGELN